MTIADRRRPAAALGAAQVDDRRRRAWRRAATTTGWSATCAISPATAGAAPGLRRAPTSVAGRAGDAAPGQRAQRPGDPLRPRQRRGRRGDRLAGRHPAGHGRDGRTSAPSIRSTCWPASTPARTAWRPSRRSAAQGLTIGHWPQSVAMSSVGGWVATRASGQFSTAYGNIEDIVHSIEAVLPDGELVTLGKGPRASAGPDLRHLMLGSEGTLGVITGVTFSLRRARRGPRRSPPSRRRTWRPASSFQREIIQSRLAPAGDAPVRRAREPAGWTRAPTPLPDPHGARRPGGAGRGRGGRASPRWPRGRASPPAPTDIVEHWLEHRNTVPPLGQLLDAQHRRRHGRGLGRLGRDRRGL